MERSFLSKVIAHGMTALFLLSLLSCTNFDHGGGSSSGNPGMTGKVVAPDGTPAMQTIVTLVPEGYDPIADQPLSGALCDTTDETGTYTIADIPADVYDLQAVNMHNRQRLLKTNIAVDQPVQRAVSDTLAQPGSVLVELPRNVDATNGYLYVPGTLIGQLLDGRSDSLRIDSVPAGILPEIRYAAKNTSVKTPIRYNIQVPAGASVIVGNPAWHYAMQFFLNTTTSGANVTGNVTDFPVLIRLSSGNFDFARAKSGGADVRFAKSDGTPLPYEIERWDSVARQAEVWVRVDTVMGNDTMQIITMYSGNADSASQSNGAQVFDTSRGFEGVWHMGQMTGALESTQRSITTTGRLPYLAPFRPRCNRHGTAFRRHCESHCHGRHRNRET